MLGVGDTAPDFTLADQAGDDRTLTQVLDDGPCVIYFYPADFSPVCTAQTCTFRDRFDDLQDVGVQIIGISPQGVSTHKRFAEQYKVPFPLLADPRKQVVRAFGVDGPLGFGVRRATFLINPHREVRSRVVSDLLLGSHRDLITEAISAA